MILLAPALAALPAVPNPSTELGAVCYATVRFDDGEQSTVDVPASCPEPFHSAIDAHLAAEPVKLESPPELLELTFAFVVGQAASVTQRREDDPSDFARPRAGSTVFL
ncbi:MAG: hypothetical protein KC656_25430, partial [Myxococcales bacterium]|nr:hypothetical protein [Myxococcales bacterium]